MRQWTIALLAVILVSGCSQSQADNGATPTPTPSSSASPAPDPSSSQEPPVLPQITVTRTGGIAGVSDAYVVNPDGTLTVEGRRTPPPGAKKLTAAEQQTLSALVAAPALRAEAASPALVKRTCADGFVYTLAVQGVRMRAMDCGTLATDAPTMWKIIQFLEVKAR